MDLTAEILMGQAEKATDLHDWGPDLSFRIGLDILVQDFTRIDRSHVVVEQFRNQLVQLLATRLRLVDDQVRHPEILDVVIDAPVVGVGLARTGTTILLDLLALDPAARAPRQWEAAFPCPPTEAGSFHTDPRIARMQGELDQLLAAIPEVRAMHPWGAELPAPCLQLFNLHFASTNFMASYKVPGYVDWLARNAQEGVYRTHKRLLQQFGWRGPRGRWTLTEPMHQLNLDLLLEAYPNAMLVQTHRDPMRTIPSTASLIYTLLSGRDPSVSREEVGQLVQKMFGAHLERSLAARERDPVLDARIVDVAYRDTVRDPVSVVRRIHDAFNLPFVDEHAERIRRHLAESPQHKNGRHVYKAEDYGITEASLKSYIPARYSERFSQLFEED